MMTESSSGQPLTTLNGQLPPGEVHVWLAKPELDDGGLSRLGSLLSPEEQLRATEFKVDFARDQFVASRSFLRTLLGKYQGLDALQVNFRLSSHGKPELADNREIHFNLSHTAGLAAIAITRAGAVGVDVERIRDQVDTLQLADRFFSAKEAGWVRTQPENERSAAFFSCWTAKEAYVKARGGGLSIPLNGFAIIPDPQELELQLEVFEDASAAKHWSLWRLELATEFKGAVAVQGKGCRMRMGWLPRL